MIDPIRRVEARILTIPRDTPYMGALRPGEEPNSSGYFVRKGNGTVYPTVDRSVLVRVETRDGVVGWGETYGLVAPRAVMAIIDDLLVGFIVDRDPWDVAVIHDDLYDLMRVRGYTGGFYLDALAAIDIALWDICGKLADKPVAKLLGGQRRRSIPAYISGLPRRTRVERAELAAEWQSRNFTMFKFAGAVADDGVVSELASLRERLGSEARIAADLHWSFTASEAIETIRAFEPYRPWFAEAPCKPEDIEGQARVAASVVVPIGLGEEWRTVHDARPRLERHCAAVVQPEMGHTGITQFMRIAHMAEAHHCQVIPHATIGLGIFLAASLQAGAAIRSLPAHEFQHSVFEQNRRLITGDMACVDGAYTVPSGAGLGVEPSEEALALLES
jgi:L-alanine-DL-glutamate epimerase-like enolase superfamily enzyme